MFALVLISGLLNKINCTVVKRLITTVNSFKLRNAIDCSSNIGGKCFRWHKTFMEGRRAVSIHHRLTNITSNYQGASQNNNTWASDYREHFCGKHTIMISHACTESKEKLQQGGNFFKTIITAEEAWLHHYDPTMKQQSSERKLLSLPALKKAKSAEKIMTIVFLDYIGIVYQYAVE